MAQLPDLTSQDGVPEVSAALAAALEHSEGADEHVDTDNAFYRMRKGSMCAQSSIGDLHAVSSFKSVHWGKAEAKRVAILTSGGDSQGMNAALRAVVRSTISLEAEPFAVQDGYDGLVKGGSNISPIHWSAVGGILHLGGTVLGTARSTEFRTEKGRKQAVKNMLMRGINHLVVIGGDGSLTGMQILYECWPEYSREILEANQNAEWYQSYWMSRKEEGQRLRAVGLVGSIDNDMTNTDMTIGCDSALRRICDAVDQLNSTANSHQREFVLEVMGRNCGWLALKAAVACGADFCFFPENPAPVNWPEVITERIQATKERGERSSITIISEGAIDQEDKPIKCHDVMEVLCKAGFESRVTILGHVQRGGSPSAYDRAASMLLGEAAAQHILGPTPVDEPQVMCIDGLFDVVPRPAKACLSANAKLVEMLKHKQFGDAMISRGRQFVRGCKAMMALQTAMGGAVGPEEYTHSVGIIHVGACSPGMNATMRALARFGACQNHRVFGFVNGMDGLHHCNYRILSWMDVEGWAPVGGAALGTTRMKKKELDLTKVCGTLEKLKLSALYVVGGWDGYQLVQELHHGRHHHPILRKIEVMAVPCSISNNPPCTSYSIGFDTALNCVMEAVDKIKLSAIAHRRVFVVEVMGNRCGYLAVFGALTTGAEISYIHEKEMTLASMQRDLDFVHSTFEKGKHMAIILVSEHASSLFTTKFIAKLFKERSNGLYDVRTAVLGHLQQGGNPSPLDRCLAVELADCATGNVVDHLEANAGKERAEHSENYRCIGIQKGRIIVSSYEDMKADMDESNRRSNSAPWMKEALDLNGKLASTDYM